MGLALGPCAASRRDGSLLGPFPYLSPQRRGGRPCWPGVARAPTPPSLRRKGAGGLGPGLTCRRDSRQRAVKIIMQFPVSDADDSEPAEREDFVPPCVVLRLFIMNAAIDFDDDTDRVAVEVHDETIDHLLAPKVKSIEPISPEMLPQERFRRGHRAPQFSSASKLPRFHLLPDDNVRNPHKHRLRNYLPPSKQKRTAPSHGSAPQSPPPPQAPPSLPGKGAGGIGPARVSFHTTRLFPFRAEGANRGSGILGDERGALPDKGTHLRA
jgi:hypothetical protein